MKHLAEYPPDIAALVASERLPGLGRGAPNREAHASLRALSVQSLGDIADRAMANACLAGLWLLHDYLDESHSISQEVRTPTGSYWHAIMHRREGDFDNAKYWFRRVGKHPVFEPLLSAAQELSSSHDSATSRTVARQTAWDPYSFVDYCEASPAGGDQELLRRIARIEWDLLFDFCFQSALGKSWSERDTG
jgi:hypothetical protein